MQIWIILIKINIHRIKPNLLVFQLTSGGVNEAFSYLLQLLGLPVAAGFGGHLVLVVAGKALLVIGRRLDLQVLQFVKSIHLYCHPEFIGFVFVVIVT